MSLAQASRLIDRLPPLVTPVLLFVNASQEEVDAALHAIPHALLQFHGDESPQVCTRLSQQGRVRYLRAARIPLAMQPVTLTS